MAPADGVLDVIGEPSDALELRDCGGLLDDYFGVHWGVNMTAARGNRRSAAIAAGDATANAAKRCYACNMVIGEWDGQSITHILVSYHSSHSPGASGPCLVGSAEQCCLDIWLAAKTSGILCSTASDSRSKDESNSESLHARLASHIESLSLKVQLRSKLNQSCWLERSLSVERGCSLPLIQ